MNNNLNYEAIAKKLMGEELTESEKNDIKNINEIHLERKSKSLNIDKETLREKECQLMM